MLDDDFLVNRRIFDRDNVHLPLRYFLKGVTGHYREGTALNLSRSGMAVRLHDSAHMDQEVFLEMLATNARQVNVKGHVVWVAPDQIVGVHFDTPISATEYNEIITYAERLSALEKKSSQPGPDSDDDAPDDGRLRLA